MMSTATALKTKAIKSTMILTTRTLLLQVVITGSNIILARILLPEAFGIFAILNFITGIANFVTDAGLTKAIIQQDAAPTNNELRTIFTIEMVLSVIGALFLWICAPIIIRFYDGHIPPETVQNLRWFTLILPFTEIGAISKAMLERQLRYFRYVIAEMITLIICKFLAIYFALHGWGVSALVIAELVSKFIGGFSYLYLYRWKIMFGWAYDEVKPVISFALSYQLSNIVQLLNNGVIPLYVAAHPGPGTFSGAEAVGFLTFTSGLVIFTRFFAEIIMQLTFPLVSRTQNDNKLVRKSLERSIEITALVSFGIIGVVWAFTPEIITIIYGNQWLPVILTLRLLLINATLMCLASILMQTILALGLAKIYRNIHIFWMSLQWIFTIFFVQRIGFTGYALASLIVGCATGVPWFLLNQKIPFSYFKKWLPQACLACTVIVMIFFVKQAINIRSFFSLIIGVVSGLFLYGVLSSIFLPHIIKAVFLECKPILRWFSTRMVDNAD